MATSPGVLQKRSDKPGGGTEPDTDGTTVPPSRSGSGLFHTVVGCKIGGKRFRWNDFPLSFFFRNVAVIQKVIRT